MGVASAAAKLSAIPALAGLLSRSSGHSEAMKWLVTEETLQMTFCHGFLSLPFSDSLFFAHGLCLAVLFRNFTASERH